MTVQPKSTITTNIAADFPDNAAGDIEALDARNMFTDFNDTYLGAKDAQEYEKTLNFNATTLSDGANISWDLESNQVASVTLAGNRTLDNPTNMVDGGTYILRVIQDGTGDRTLAYGSAYKFPSGTAPVLTTGTPSAVDILTFVSDGTNMYGVFQGDFS